MMYRLKPGVHLTVLIFICCPELVVNEHETKVNQQATSVVMVSSDDADVTVEDENVEDMSSDTFVPSEEWKTIKPGQVIPKGLHVRMNLATGEKEAKLLDSEQMRKTHYSKEELAEFLKKMESEIGTPESSYSAPAPGLSENTVDIRSRFRSIEELKREFETMELSMKTETEIVISLMKTFENLRGSESEQAAILKEMVYHVHQFDVAKDFVKHGGFSAIVLPSFNASDAELRKEALSLAAAAMQSNPLVQIAGLEANFIREFLRLLTFDPDKDVRRYSVSAISSLTRGFPLAQLRLFQEGAVQVFASVFEFKDDNLMRKVQLKIVTLIQDLLVERRDLALHFNSSDTSHVEKAKQYVQVRLEDSLKQGGFCAVIPPLFLHPAKRALENDKRGKRLDLGAARSHDIPLRPEHDTLQKILEAMISLVSFCSDEFRSVATVLKELEQFYLNLSHRENAGGDEYFGMMSGICRKLLKLLESPRQKYEL